LEAEIRNIEVQSQPRQKVHETLSQPIAGVVAHTCHPNYGRKYKIGGFWFRLARAKSKTLSQKLERKGLEAWLK
jgi:hypothetical protein